MRIVLLGCGFHGRGIAYQLAAAGPEVELSVLDRDAGRAAAVGDKAGVPWRTVDVTEPDSLRAALADADLVVNAVGPYHQTALGVIEAAVDAGVHYVDMNDDHEVAEAVLLDASWDERARRAGVTVLIDCGVVPGLSGLLVRHAAEQLDRTDRVAIRFAWNYNREYPAALQHFLRINSGEGPQYVEGRHTRMRPFAGREDVEFQPPVGRRASTSRVCRIPWRSPASSPACGTQRRRAPTTSRRRTACWRTWSDGECPRYDLLTSLGSAADIPRHDLPLALRVEVEGSPATLSYEAHDHSRRATTTFTALAALAVARGELAPGVLAPEAWPDPGAFLRGLLAERDIRILQWRDQEPATPLDA